MDSTKQKILSAATELFAQHGFAGTSVGKIAKLANVNHSLVFHHFINKEKLWVAAKVAIVADAEQGGSLLPDTALPFAEFLQQLFARMIQFYRSQPKLLRMIGWQRLELGNKQQDDVSLRSDIIEQWIAAFAIYQQQGDIKSQLNIEFVVSMTVSLISAIGIDANVLLSTADSEQAYIEFCIASLLKVI